MKYPEVKLASKRGFSLKKKALQTLDFSLLDFKHSWKTERSEVIHFAQQKDALIHYKAEAGSPSAAR